MHLLHTMVSLPERNDKVFGLDFKILNFLEPASAEVSEHYSFEAESIIKPVRLLERESIVYREIIGENRYYMGGFSRNSIEGRYWFDKKLVKSSCFMLYICTIKEFRYVLFL